MVPPSVTSLKTYTSFSTLKLTKKLVPFGPANNEIPLLPALNADAKVHDNALPYVSVADRSLVKLAEDAAAAKIPHASPLVSILANPWVALLFT